jgi:eukaryotic-like serine/threonine-protein kinase
MIVIDQAAAAAHDGGPPSFRCRHPHECTGRGPSRYSREHQLSMPPLRGRYRLEARIAVGGMGEVWRARDTRLGRIVAVKLLRPEYAGSAEFRDRLRLEARHTAMLSHPGLVQVRDYDNGPAGGAPYLVMEYVAGPSLAAVLRAEGTLSPGRVLGLIAQAAEALACAHAAGIVHRDMKPANVLIDGGQVKIADFGIAQTAGAVPVTLPGLVIGTPAYLSPEQVAGLPATPASDLYGLGIIAYECLTGRPPFAGSPLAVALAHRERPLPPLPGTVSGPVAELVAALTAKDPLRRPGDALAVADWARRVLRNPQVIQAPAGPVRTSGSLLPAQPAQQVTRSLPRQVPRSAAARVLLLLTGWAGRTAQRRFGDAPRSSHRPVLPDRDGRMQPAGAPQTSSQLAEAT